MRYLTAILFVSGVMLWSGAGAAQNTAKDKAACENSSGAGWHQVTPDAGWDARGRHAAVVHDGRMWVLGGNAIGSKVSDRRNDVWWSQDGQTWTEATAAASWGIRAGHAAVSYAGKLWVIGGLSSGTPVMYADVWSSEDGEAWTEVTSSAPWGGRQGHCVVVHSGLMWLLGGETGSEQFASDVWYSSDGAAWYEATPDGG